MGGGWTGTPLAGGLKLADGQEEGSLWSSFWFLPGGWHLSQIPTKVVLNRCFGELRVGFVHAWESLGEQQLWEKLWSSVVEGQAGQPRQEVSGDRSPRAGSETQGSPGAQARDSCQDSGGLGGTLGGRTAHMWGELC